MSKRLIITLTLTLISLVGVFCVWKQRTALAPVTSKPVVTPQPTPEPEYPQHIEAIPGNSDEVWYNIPELGVRMKLNKDFAEELIYSDGMVDDSGQPQTGIYFSTKGITEVAPECAPRRGGALGSFYKAVGVAKEDAKENFLLQRDLQEDVIQFEGFYIGYVGNQAVPWFPQHEGAVRKVWVPEDYKGSGAKYISQGMKTLQLIPSR